LINVQPTGITVSSPQPYPLASLLTLIAFFHYTSHPHHHPNKFACIASGLHSGETWSVAVLITKKIAMSQIKDRIKMLQFSKQMQTEHHFQAYEYPK
jgi:hypothetical protein